VERFSTILPILGSISEERWRATWVGSNDLVCSVRRWLRSGWYYRLRHTRLRAQPTRERLGRRPTISSGPTRDAPSLAVTQHTAHADWTLTTTFSVVRSWMPKRKCPRCGGDAHRSYFQDQDERYVFLLRSPYRCEGCGQRFWAVSRKARGVISWLLILVILLMASAFLAFVIPGEIP